ncbi:hypothetical protein GBF38_000530, partial [Nibea albiflora]
GLLKQLRIHSRSQSAGSQCLSVRSGSAALDFADFQCETKWTRLGVQNDATGRVLMRLEENAAALTAEVSWCMINTPQFAQRFREDGLGCFDFDPCVVVQMKAAMMGNDVAETVQRKVHNKRQSLFIEALNKSRGFCPSAFYEPSGQRPHMVKDADEEQRKRSNLPTHPSFYLRPSEERSLCCFLMFFQSVAR